LTLQTAVTPSSSKSLSSQLARRLALAFVLLVVVSEVLTPDVIALNPLRRVAVILLTSASDQDSTAYYYSMQTPHRTLFGQVSYFWRIARSMALELLWRTNWDVEHCLVEERRAARRLQVEA
jgi:hypothetical protein